MDVKTWSILLLFLLEVVLGIRKDSFEDRRPGYQRDTLHYQTKRHMIPTSKELKKRPTTQKIREIRKKPSGHLKPLDEDDMENDEVVSVAVGPPPVRPKYEKSNQWKQTTKSNNNNNNGNITISNSVTNLVKDVLAQIGQEFLTHQISEDFVFGQYVGNAMKNLTSDLRLKMQHEVLELVLKYQRLITEEIKLEGPTVTIKDPKGERKLTPNDTDENWPDFSNLAKIVGRR